MMDIEIPTHVAGLVLRPLSKDEADPYYRLIEQNRDHLTKYGDYQETIQATPESVVEGSLPSRPNEPVRHLARRESHRSSRSGSP